MGTNRQSNRSLPLPMQAPLRVVPLRNVLAARAVAICVAGSGALGLLSLLGGSVPSEVPHLMGDFFPIDFAGLGRWAILILGFALILSAIHLWSFKRRALQLTIPLALASAFVHLTIRWSWERATCSLALAGMLWYLRPAFRVGSGKPRLAEAVRRAASALLIAMAYGVAGFWLLEPDELGQNFHWWQAAMATWRYMSFLGNQGLTAHSAYAVWFLDSLYWMPVFVAIYAGFVLFRPVLYQFSPNLEESAQAQELTECYGSTGLDYFKHGSDKSLFFSRTGRSYIGYRVAHGFALVLGDPVGPLEESRAVVEDFITYCQDRGWRVGFHQVRPDRLAAYESLGFRKLKIGDDAIVDLSRFSLHGNGMKEFRNTVARLDRLGYRVQQFDPPVDAFLVERLALVSDQWLSIPGHRERQFALGRFESRYVQSLPTYVVFDHKERIAAFLNLVPSYRPGLATVDLMRRRPDSINGIIDYLFAKVFLSLKEEGYTRFSLGMAPLVEFAEDEKPTTEEMAVRWFVKRFPSLFRADGLRRFKFKYAHVWESRYEVYQSRWDLPRLALALRSVAEVSHREAA